MSTPSSTAAPMLPFSNSAGLSSTTHLSPTCAPQNGWPQAAQPGQAAPQSSKQCPTRHDRAGEAGNPRPEKGATSLSWPRALRTPRKGRRQAVGGKPPIMRPAHPRREPQHGQVPSCATPAPGTSPGADPGRWRSHPAVAMCQGQSRPPRVGRENRTKSLLNRILLHTQQLCADRAEPRV